MKEVLGKKIKDFRKKKGYTIVDMVELTGINKSNYSHMENGKLNFTLDSLSKICEVLNIDIDLFEKEEQKMGQK